MHLTKEETEMLAGKYGYPVQKSMEILAGLGECYDAERFIPVASAHLLCSRHIGKAGALFNKEMADKGGKFVTFTDANPLSIEPYVWKEMGFSEESVRDQMETTNTYARMGLFLSNTCTPYLIGHFPRLGEHVAWSESSAVIFANSVLGARTNREAWASSLAAALTGRVPAYGYHLEQNRRGNLEILVTAKLKDTHDYGTLGYFMGKTAEDKVPVLDGIPFSVSIDQLKMLGAGSATSGSIALYHIVGITPEAPAKEAVLGLRKSKDWQTFEFGEKELRETEELLSKAATKKVDLVVLGCPHASIAEIGEVARMLSGKKANSGVELWVFTFGMMKDYARKMGYVGIIEEAGGRVLCETCPSAMPNGFAKRRGHSVAATNSAKMTFYMAGEQDVLSHYGSTERCIKAAISGIWR